MHFSKFLAIWQKWITHRGQSFGKRITHKDRSKPDNNFATYEKGIGEDRGLQARRNFVLLPLAGHQPRKDQSQPPPPIDVPPPPRSDGAKYLGLWGQISSFSSSFFFFFFNTTQISLVSVENNKFLLLQKLSNLTFHFPWKQRADKPAALCTQVTHIV